MVSTLYRRNLPAGWYPSDADGVEEFLERSGVGEGRRDGSAAIVPHAGWRFSGALAAKGIASLIPAETVVVVGGHLHAGAGIQLLPFEKFETPCGNLQLDRDFVEFLRDTLTLEENPAVDNSTEVQFPLIARFHPGCRVVVLRAAPSAEAAELGRAAARYARHHGSKIVMLGSTDLTHYGPDYGFAPRGPASTAVDWVRDTNDKSFIDAALGMDWREVIAAGVENRAACSSGAAAATVEFARETGAEEGSLLGYGTSYDIYPGESIVGYASILFRQSKKG